MNIHETLTRLGQGAVAEELQIQLQKAAQESVAQGGASIVKLTLKLTPNGNDGVEIVSEVSSKTPTVRHAKTFLYLGDDGALSADDPKQLKLIMERSDV